MAGKTGEEEEEEEEEEGEINRKVMKFKRKNKIK